MSDVQIKILSGKEFSRLGPEDTRGADISNSLGFADVKNRKVFVRDTGIDELNRYLVLHEVDHLFTDDRAHEDELVEGIRHKKFKEVISAIPIIGPLLAPPSPKLPDPISKRQETAPGTISERGATSPLGAFKLPGSPATPRLPGATVGGISGSLASGLGTKGAINSPLQETVRQRQQGFLSGRSPFDILRF